MSARPCDRSQETTIRNAPLPSLPFPTSSLLSHVFHGWKTLLQPSFHGTWGNYHNDYHSLAHGRCSRFLPFFNIFLFLSSKYIRRAHHSNRLTYDLLYNYSEIHHPEQY
ncbi:hypothetical protein MPTK1_7g18830 [Marchantia polymorpha subsp. ruderalis]|uniref:Uncharacterized protein n=2 Tax=Marchantia polymorpha TaxID=3197 RepID=A0AAF6C179_MARPO|nr:hypothetical protein MARPO_0067s0094 [Marchantia polymorpha]BBN18013.1 hypothetical protein Mp_7g18830 [Marchantia polymorpha subsp. ruderalis]|eukprot:PTQ36022.1 hypothetical protein MARPO_0067s0094 [Marchantia polymorpha]